VASGLPANEATSPASRCLSDTHAHLNLSDYESDRAEVIERARAAGVGFIVNVGFDLATSRESVALAGAHDFIYASVGLHPHEAATLDDGLLDALRLAARSPKVVAIGETGLDYYRNLSPAADQERAFRSQIRLARELGLPLIIHNRAALDQVLRIVDDERAGEVGGVMHCFPGDAEYAREVVARGFFVGIGGPVTYAPGGRLVDVAASLPLSRLLLETDAPWLPPVPHRGKRNEPSYVALVAATVARIRGISVDDLGRATTGNAVKLFRIPGKPAPSIVYEMWGNLYLNITNRCTGGCTFCVRRESDVLWGHNLKLEREPGVEEIIEAVGDPTRYREVVFCGYGEPTLRLDVVTEVGARLVAAGGRVRLNTNGHGNLIWKRNIVPEIAQAVHAVSVSLNAGDAETYERLCRPSFGAGTFEHVLDFVRECKAAGLSVTVSVVDVPGVDLSLAKSLADALGVPLRVRGSGIQTRSA
jgi:TatD DNase family protein